MASNEYDLAREIVSRKFFIDRKSAFLLSFAAFFLGRFREPTYRGALNLIHRFLFRLAPSIFVFVRGFLFVSPK